MTSFQDLGGRRTFPGEGKVAFQRIPADSFKFITLRNEIPREEACKVLRRSVYLWSAAEWMGVHGGRA
jgi:hypothetical protein